MLSRDSTTFLAQGPNYNVIFTAIHSIIRTAVRNRTKVGQRLHVERTGARHPTPLRSVPFHLIYASAICVALSLVTRRRALSLPI